jgi:hypothetical protein
MEEVLVTISAIRKREDENRKFAAALQGVDLEENSSQGEDITSIKGFRAQQDGFGIGLGLGHIVEG